jgi:hypothetical protein
MHMNISDPRQDDVTLQEVAQHAGCTVKTVRRAIQAGQLSRRYVMSARGPQLVFTPAEVEQWLGDRVGRRRAGHQPAQARGGASQADWAQLSERVMQLHTALLESRTTMAAISAKLSEQDAILVEARDALATLAVRLDAVEARLPAAAQPSAMAGDAAVAPPPAARKRHATRSSS